METETGSKFEAGKAPALHGSKPINKKRPEKQQQRWRINQDVTETLLPGSTGGEHNPSALQTGTKSACLFILQPHGLHTGLTHSDKHTHIGPVGQTHVEVIAMCECVPGRTRRCGNVNLHTWIFA